MAKEDYFSLDVQKSLHAKLHSVGLTPYDAQVKGHLRDNLAKALDEIVSTPEGLAAAKRAALNSEDGKVNFIYVEDANSVALITGDIRIGGQDRTIRFPNEDPHQPHQNVTLQRLVYHELQHIAYGMNERQAIKATNDFMQKYYDEPPRGSDHGAFLLDGTHVFDFNPNFNPNGYDLQSNYAPNNLKTALGRLSEQQAEQLSPEAQSLYELKGSLAAFADQLSTLHDSNALNAVKSELTQIGFRDSFNATAQQGVAMNDPNFDATPHPSLTTMLAMK